MLGLPDLPPGDVLALLGITIAVMGLIFAVGTDHSSAKATPAEPEKPPVVDPMTLALAAEVARLRALTTEAAPEKPVATSRPVRAEVRRIGPRTKEPDPTERVPPDVPLPPLVPIPIPTHHRSTTPEV